MKSIQNIKKEISARENHRRKVWTKIPKKQQQQNLTRDNCDKLRNPIRGLLIKTLKIFLIFEERREQPLILDKPTENK